MIQIIVKEIKNQGKYRWTCSQYGVEGVSRQPLLDACREIKRTDASLIHQQIGLYRPGKEEPDVFCTVGWGAAHTVDESVAKFHKWKPRQLGTWHDASA